MERLISTSTQNENLSEVVILIRSIWLLTSDFPISDEDAEKRAEQWVKLLGQDFFGKHGRYAPYIVTQACRERSFRGAIHADEFYRMFCRVVLEKQVYSFLKREWVSENEAMEKILNSNESLTAEYYRAQDLSDDAVQSVLDKCRAIIYGWEE